MFYTKEKAQKLENSIVSAVKTIFGDKGSNAEKVIDLTNEIARLKINIRIEKDSLAEVRAEYKQEKTEIEFLIKMKEEKQELEKEKSVVALEKKTAELEKNLQKEYFTKTEALLKEHKDEMQKISTAILDRLPDVNLAISQGFKPEEKK